MFVNNLFSHNLHQRYLTLTVTIWTYNIVDKTRLNIIDFFFNFSSSVSCFSCLDSDVMLWSKQLLPFAEHFNQMRHFQEDGWCKAKLSVFSWFAKQTAFTTLLFVSACIQKLSVPMGVIEFACKMEMPMGPTELNPQTSKDVFLTARKTVRSPV